MWVNRVVGGSCRSLADFHNALKADVAGMISKRTNEALAAAKRRGVQLGGDRGGRSTAKARKAGGEAMQRAAEARAADLAPIIAELQASGAESLRAIAAGLNARGITTARGAPVPRFPICDKKKSFGAHKPTVARCY